MKKLNLLKALSVVVLLVMLVLGCSTGSDVDTTQGNEEKSKDDFEPIVMKYNDINSPQSPQADFGNEFASLVEQKTEGRVKVDTYYGGSLVGYDIEPVRNGTVEFNQLIPSNVADLAPALSILDAPYLFEDNDHILKVTDPRSQVVKAINEELKTNGVRFITALPMGMRHITTDKEIKSVEDLKGLKIRVVPSDIYMDTMSEFGVVPTPMDFSEVATAITTGVIDGQENPFSVIVPNGIHEIQEYVALTEHLPTLAGIFMNNEKFEQLSPEDQELLLDAAVEARDKVASDIEESEKQWKEEALNAGMKIIDEENGLQLGEFKEKGKKIHEKYKETWGELYDQIIEMGE